MNIPMSAKLFTGPSTLLELEETPDLSDEECESTRGHRKTIEHQDSRPLGQSQRDEPVRAMVAAALRRLSTPQLSYDSDKGRVEDRDEKYKDWNCQNGKDPA